MPCGFVLQGIFSCLLALFGYFAGPMLCQVFAVGQIASVSLHSFENDGLAHSVSSPDCRP